jgi:hypothetical protein
VDGRRAGSGADQVDGKEVQVPRKLINQFQWLEK